MSKPSSDPRIVEALKNDRFVVATRGKRYVSDHADSDEAMNAVLTGKSENLIVLNPKSAGGVRF